MDNNCNEEGLIIVPNYELDAARYNDTEESIPVRKKPKLPLNWKLVQRFENFEQAKTSVNAEDTWSQHYVHQTDEGKKTYYRCNKLQRRGPQCSSKMYLLFDSTSASVFMFKTNAEHDHDHHEKKAFTSSYGLSDTVKKEINRLLDLKMKPKAIMDCLSTMKDIKVPKMSQLRNYLSERRHSTNVQYAISLGELEAWIHSHSRLPLDPHEVFVACYEIDQSDEQNPIFRFTVSTKHLIEISKVASVVHAAATCNLTWQGFPVLVCGTTDRNRKFHPLCVTISSNEHEDFKLMFQGLEDKIHEIYGCSWNPNMLISDSAKNIQNAFVEVFGEHVVVRICWTHAKKQIQERTKLIKNKLLRDNILNDVDSLHSITDHNVFDVASEAFLQKYKDQIEFVTYFRAQWLVQNRNWFMGVAPNSPSSNNALESFNRDIKESNTLRERFPLSKFLVVIKDMVNQWSSKYNTNPEDS